MNKVIILFLLFAFSGITKAENLSIYFGAASIHPFSKLDLNEDHKMLAVDYKGLFAGYFRNSFDEDSFALGYRAKIFEKNHWEFGLLVGASYGYRDCTSGFKGYYEYREYNVNEDGTLDDPNDFKVIRKKGGYGDYLESPQVFKRADRRICPGVVPMLTYTQYQIKPTVMVVGDAVALSARYDF